MGKKDSKLEDEDKFKIEYIRRNKSFDMKDDHSHTGFEIYYLLSGERYYFIKNRTYHVKKGNVVFINKHTLHKTSSFKKKLHERILVSFEGEFLNDMIKKRDDINFFYSFQEEEILKLNIEEQAWVENLLFNMIQERKNKDVGYTTYIKTLLIELLIFCSRLIKKDRPKKHNYPNATHEKIARVANYININYRKQLKLKSVANQFYLSPSYLSKIFKKVTGFTFVEYKNNVRIKEAQRLLQQTELNVSEIASRVGYNNITHFGRVFKDIVDVSPLQYRNINRSG